MNNDLYGELPIWARNFFWSLYLNLTEFYSKKGYSQYGEDILLSQFIKKDHGFYIDVGCNHPKRFSNSYLFYKKGWSGVAIDVNSNLIKLFKFFRPKDISLTSAVSECDSRLGRYYQFDETPLNGFLSRTEVKKLLKKGYKVIGYEDIKFQRLRDILSGLKIKSKIDFMSIDVEGMGLEVLKSSDWELYKPTFIYIEDENFNPEHPNKSDVHVFLKRKGYSLLSVVFKTLLYKIDDNS